MIQKPLTKNECLIVDDLVREPMDEDQERRIRALYDEVWNRRLGDLKRDMVFIPTRLHERDLVSELLADR